MFSISDVFNKSWSALKDQLALVAGLTLVYFVGLSAISMVPLVSSILTGPFTAGYMVCLLKIRKKQEIDYMDVFWGFQNFNRFLQLVIAGAIVMIGTIIGFIFLIIPGIWFVIASVFTTSYIVLKDTDAVTAVKDSLAAVKGNWWSVFLLMIVMGLIGLAGAMCFLVGLLVAIPVTTMMMLTTAESLASKTTTAPSGSPSVMTVNP